MRAVRTRVPDDTALMVDYNQALGVADAIGRARALDAEGVYWIEEPIRHDDFRGCAEIAAAVAEDKAYNERVRHSVDRFHTAMVYDMQKALDARACDYVMPDLERIGGITGWQRASTLAAAAGMPMSSHLYPEVSAHLLAELLVKPMSADEVPLSVVAKHVMPSGFTALLAKPDIPTWLVGTEAELTLFNELVPAPNEAYTQLFWPYNTDVFDLFIEQKLAEEKARKAAQKVAGRSFAQ